MGDQRVSGHRAVSKGRLLRSHLSTAQGTAGKRMSILMGRSCRRSRSTDICMGERGRCRFGLVSGEGGGELPL